VLRCGRATAGGDHSGRRRPRNRPTSPPGYPPRGRPPAHVAACGPPPPQPERGVCRAAPERRGLLPGRAGTVLPGAQDTGTARQRHGTVRGDGVCGPAVSLSRHVGAVHLSVDSLEDGMLRAGLEPGWTTGVAAYETVGPAAR